MFVFSSTVPAIDINLIDISFAVFLFYRILKAVLLNQRILAVMWDCGLQWFIEHFNVSKIKVLVMLQYMYLQVFVVPTCSVA